MSETHLLDKLRPHEKVIIHIEEVLLLKRPVVFGLVLLIIIGTAGAIRSNECGLFSTIALIAIVAYSIAMIWVYFSAQIEKYLFPQLSPEKLNSGVKLYSLEELVNLYSIHFSKAAEKNVLPRTAVRNLIYAGICFALAIFFNFVSVFYFNVILAVLLLCAPFIFSQPIVYNLIHKKKKDE